MKKLIYLFIWTMVVNSSMVYGQFKDEKLIKAEITKFSKSFDDVEIAVKISATGCVIPKIGFAHIHPTIRLVSAQKPEKIYYEKSPIFITVDNSTCARGQYQDSTKITIPDHFFVDNEDFMLIVELKNYDKKWTTHTKPFRVADMNLKKKDVATYIRASNNKIINAQRGVQLSFDYSTNSSSSVTSYVKVFLNGVACGNAIYTSLDAGNNRGASIHIPFTNLYIPAGRHTLTYKVYAESFNIKERELFSGTFSILQPSLYLLSFESKNADIDVKDMDMTSSLVRVFSQSKGGGNGDAYYVIRSSFEELFVSKVANDSGRIMDHQATIQVYPDEQLTVTFYDKDTFTKEFIASFDFKPKMNGVQDINIKRGKIINFDFTYKIKPATTANLNKR
jgi:hypothetical protein